MSTPENAAASLIATSPVCTRLERVLSCVSCSQRKVKCDRNVPCSNCRKSGVRCVQPTPAPRQRRRRFAERDLLQQLRQYESLLRENRIDFKPLHGDNNNDLTALMKTDAGNGSDNELASLPPPTFIEKTPPTQIRTSKNFWHAVHQKFSEDPSSEELGEKVSRRAWDNVATNNDLLHIGRHHGIDLLSMHPSPVHIFKMWQIYLDNVNPLVKVVHAPTMQTNIIEAIGNLKKVSSVQTALMFGIYCMAIHSLSEEECLQKLGQQKELLSSTYQLGCRQALVEANYLQSQDCDCLTALYLYLASVSTSVTPTALSSVFGLAVRIAQRMGLQNEEDNGGYEVLEAEMRRRLWWALSLMDMRINQLAEFRSPASALAWDCAIPLNVNDTDLRPGMEAPPLESHQPTDAICAVVRAELGAYAKKGCALADIEEIFEAKYFKHCDLSNPLHFMTVWSARSFLAKFRLFEIYTKTSTSSAQFETELVTADLHAIRLLECDTKVMTSPLTKPYMWLVSIHFPGPAYVHLLKSLAKRPKSANANRAWQVLSENYESWYAAKFKTNEGFKYFFAIYVQQAWAARETLAFQDDERLPVPRIVSKLRQGVESNTGERVDVGNDWATNTICVDPPYSMIPQLETPLTMDLSMTQFGWPALNWDMSGASSW